MTCPINDQNLLLLAHNALGPISRLRVLWHLRRCPDCQANLRRFENVSQKIAGALRPAGLAPWKPSSAGVTGLSPIKPATLLLLAALVAVLFTMVVVVGSHLRPHQSAPGGISGKTGPCRPDLPNSRCR